MNLAVAISGAVIVALLLGVGGYLLLFPTQPLTLTHQVSASPKSIRAPGNIIATFSSTSNRQAPALIEYTILSKAGRTITSGKRAVTITGFEAETINIPIGAATPPGPYWLRSRVTSGDTYSVALTGIIILAQPTPPKSLPVPQAPAGNETTPVQPPIPPTQPNASPSILAPPIPTLPPPPGPGRIEPVVTPPSQPGQVPFSDGMSVEDTISKARTLAATDAAKADSLCTPLPPSDKDNCHSEVALTSKTSSYCFGITDVPSKDACLANLALIGDFSVCESMTNPDIKDSCFALKGT